VLLQSLQLIEFIRGCIFGPYEIAQQKGTLWIGINLNQAVTIVWRTKPGTMLSIGLKLQHHCINGLLPLLVAVFRMPQGADQTEFLFRMEPHRGTPLS
jgi:hypothetical protein